MVRKLLVIGLDGASLDLILPWVSSGELPNFKKLIEDGIHGKLLSTRPPMTCPAWPVFMTGKNPGKLGVYDFIIGNSDEARVVNFTDIKAHPFWEIAGREGFTSIVVNVPITYPPRIHRGILLSGMLTPQGGRYWSDNHIMEDIIEKVGKYRVDLDILCLSTLEKRRSLESLFNMTETRFRTVKYLMKNYPFDIVVCVFQITDILCHRLWHRKEEILKAYKQIDGYLHWFIEGDNNIFVISDHGFGEFSKWILIDQYLCDLGLVAKRKATIHDGITRGSSQIQELRFGGKKGFSQKAFRASKGFFLSLGISRKDVEVTLRNLRLSRVLRRYIPNVFKRFLPPARHGVDYAMSKAYLHSSRTRSIVINKDFYSNRSCYQERRDDLREKLLNLRDPESGEKVISKVFFREEIYSGKYMELMPDLYLEPAPGYLIRSGFNESVIKSFVSPKSSHEASGILIARGPDIRMGEWISGASITDLAPTFLHLMGLDIPEDIDGKVLLGLFRKDSEPRQRRVSYTCPVEEMVQEEVRLSHEQEILIRDRLRGLGYID